MQYLIHHPLGSHGQADQHILDPIGSSIFLGVDLVSHRIPVKLVSVKLVVKLVELMLSYL